MQDIIKGWFTFDFRDGKFVVGPTKDGLTPERFHESWVKSQDGIIDQLKKRKTNHPRVFEKNTSDMAKLMLSLLDV